MRIGRALGALVVSLGLLTAGASVAQAQTTGAPAPSTYYLSLGDSLSQGYQPTGTEVGSPGVNTDNGYADVLYQRLLPAEPGLVLEKDGCSGETTTSMLNGGPYCANQPGGPQYAGTQVAKAVQFLTDHKGQVTHLTLDIGANDVQSCATSAGIDFACVGQGLVAISQNLPKILAQLRAADPAVHITGSTYYNPFLVYWLGSGSTDKFLALGSSVLQVVLNQILTSSYSAYGAATADVAGAFKSYAYVPFVASPYSPDAAVPLNVATLCEQTYMCRQQNIHATDSGYVLMADAFQRAGA
ncbi:hypothetical protein GCM10027047_02430 [Rhodococcus aerolatus]